MTGANSVVILVTAAGPERRGQALGIMAATQAIGFALGPTAGGVLLGTLGWRWIFWVNVPLSILAFILSWLVVPKTTKFADDSRFDWIGAMLLVPGLATLLVVIAQSHAWGFRRRSSLASRPRPSYSPLSSGIKRGRQRRAWICISFARAPLPREQLES